MKSCLLQLIGLLGALVSADIVAAFSGQLEQALLLAFFVPGIVYLVDAIGTQSETLMIRGLSVGASLRHAVRREMLTGFLIGLVLSLFLFPIIVLRWGDLDVAISVALSLLIASSVATAVAVALPWALNRLGGDPAFASGPLATVILDILSIVIYFAISLGFVQ